jgi:hypothetical protein
MIIYYWQKFTDFIRYRTDKELEGVDFMKSMKKYCDLLDKKLIELYPECIPQRVEPLFTDITPLEKFLQRDDVTMRRLPDDLRKACLEDITIMWDPENEGYIVSKFDFEEAKKAVLTTDDWIVWHKEGEMK